jgi:3-oxoacyl-[acyl-carrier protein] reductase
VKAGGHWRGVSDAATSSSTTPASLWPALTKGRERKVEKLQGKAAVVTGASKGIGASIAKHLAAEGAAVVVNYATSEASADRVVAEILSGGGQAVAVQADVAKPEDVRGLFAETKRVFGRLDVLVNNAGVYEYLPLEAITAEHLHRLFSLNVFGLITASQEAVKHFGSDGGSIINIGSVVSTYAPANGSAYSATKAAVDAITRSLAKELGPRKVRVNSINPGMVATEGARAGGFLDGEFRRQIEASTPLGRIGEPVDIALAAVFLASADSAWITGETLVVAGGFR